jgi:hypothetical protein
MAENKSCALYLAVVKFDDVAEVVQEKVRVTDANAKNLHDLINQKISPGGGTNILAGLESATKAFNLTTTAKTTDGCVKSLIFLTDGGDSHVRSDKLTSLQKQWVDHSINLCAIGISKAHHVAVMETIVQNDKKEFLANASYQWVPDANDGQTTEGKSLEQIVDLIFKQTLSKAFESVTVRQTFGPPLEMLNGPKNLTAQPYDFGGLSQGEQVQKFFYWNFSDRGNFAFEVVAKNMKGEETKRPLEFTLGTSYDQDVHLEGFKHHLVSKLALIRGIQDQDQRKALVKPLNEEAKTFPEPDDDLKALLQDLAQIEQEKAQDQDQFARDARYARGRMDVVDDSK